MSGYCISYIYPIFTWKVIPYYNLNDKMLYLKRKKNKEEYLEWQNSFQILFLRTSNLKTYLLVQIMANHSSVESKFVHAVIRS